MGFKNTSKRQAPIPPGEMLRDALDRVGLSANAAAGKMNIPANRLTAILNGQHGTAPCASPRRNGCAVDQNADAVRSRRS